MTKRRHERRLKTRPHRFGPGKVHRLVYDSLNRDWHPACTGPFRHYQGEVIDDVDIEVTCRAIGCNPSWEEADGEAVS